jgi:hypothetical protein
MSTSKVIMASFEEWIDKLNSLAVLRNEIFDKVEQIQSLVTNLNTIQRVCLTIWETRGSIPFEIREEAVAFFVKFHAECLYFVADMVVQCHDGRLIRLHEKQNNQERHKTDRLDYFDYQLNSKDPATLTLLSFKGFEYERSTLKKSSNDFKNKSSVRTIFCSSLIFDLIFILLSIM